MEQEIFITRSRACEIEFIYRGEELRLWIITGGTPALAFKDYSRSVRYPTVEMYTNDKWQTHHYAHQKLDWKTGLVTPPISLDVLPNSINDVDAYLDHMLPRRDLERTRKASLPQVREILSRRKHDKNDRTYVWAKVDISRGYVSPVTFDSKYYGGRCENHPGLFDLFEKEWTDAINVLNPVFDRMDGKSGWDDLSDEVFTDVHDVLWKLYNLK